jgi:hypothetical protein
MAETGHLLYTARLSNDPWPSIWAMTTATVKTGTTRPLASGLALPCVTKVKSRRTILGDVSEKQPYLGVGCSKCGAERQWVGPSDMSVTTPTAIRDRKPPYTPLHWYGHGCDLAANGGRGMGCARVSNRLLRIPWGRVETSSPRTASVGEISQLRLASYCSGGGG